MAGPGQYMSTIRFHSVQLNLLKFLLTCNIPKNKKFFVNRESEYHVFGLICESKFSAAMTYFRQKHRIRWMTGQTASEDDDVKAAVDIYCRLIAERGESELRCSYNDRF